ncbi:hypothetical protein [Palaeococcus ferrophilus]|uniref:hypothetical protein n=1 Tax=Palaeococcus ferrophilus TaxID=83868 RepID=UPI0012FC8B92|nr:hypothetical protein [Palaeococcus ferrophilus]
MDEVTKLERMLEVNRALKERFAREEARILRLLKQAKQAKMKGVNERGTRA